MTARKALLLPKISLTLLHAQADRNQGWVRLGASTTHEERCRLGRVSAVDVLAHGPYEAVLPHEDYLEDGGNVPLLPPQTVASIPTEARRVGDVHSRGQGRGWRQGRGGGGGGGGGGAGFGTGEHGSVGVVVLTVQLDAHAPSVAFPSKASWWVGKLRTGDHLPEARTPQNCTETVFTFRSFSYVSRMSWVRNGERTSHGFMSGARFSLQWGTQALCVPQALGTTYATTQLQPLSGRGHRTRGKCSCL